VVCTIFGPDRRLAAALPQQITMAYLLMAQGSEVSTCAGWCSRRTQKRSPGLRRLCARQAFADGAERAHARRWTNRQSGSAVRGTTTAVLIVAEAMHGSAVEDVQRLTAALAEELNAV
jgi:hypothetical protein